MTTGEMAWLLAHGGVVALILARVLGMAWTAPALATPGVDSRARLILGALLAAVLIPSVGPQLAAPLGWEDLARACLAELAVGAALGWSASLIIAGARQAGELVGAQAGLSAAALFDPEAGEELTPLGHWYALVALGTFLALDGPIALMRAVVQSYEVVPVGSLALTTETVQRAFGQVGAALELALRAAAPPALALALAGLAIGLLGRAAPSLQLVSLSMPIRAALGMLLFGLAMAALVATLTTAWGRWPGGY
ncbi:flagellar biosynthetic protein FliR [Singulisphaera sp. PoT]|uniref:flagellar biosynthetic protein FliR n=1 Tax=Singulisphaera sp. PoT TaxID=3411797 RepID=UPI003BF4D1A8